MRLKKLIVVVSLFSLFNSSHAITLRKDEACLEPFLNQKWQFEPTYTGPMYTSGTTIITFSGTTDVTVDSKKLEGIADSDASKWYLSCEGEDYDLSYYDSFPNEMGSSNSISYKASFKYSNGATEVTGDYGGAFHSITLHHGVISFYGAMIGNLLSSQKTYEVGWNDGITKCQNDPAYCGITASCSHVDASFSPNDGVLIIPAVDVPDVFGGITTYQVEMSRVPGEEWLFSVTNAKPIQ